jgi:hypothetical protein
MFARIRILGRRVTVVLASLAAAGSALVAGAAAAGNSPAGNAGARFDTALDHYESGRYQVAFDEFAVLADQGHCEAARIARQMARYGPALYGAKFAVAPARLEQWRRLPGCATAEPESR